MCLNMVMKLLMVMVVVMVHFIPLGRWTGMTVQCALMSCVRSP